MINGIWQSLRLDFVNINILAKFRRNFQTDQEIGPVYVLRIGTSAKPRVLTNFIDNPFEQDLVNINETKFHENFLHV